MNLPVTHDCSPGHGENFIVTYVDDTLKGKTVVGEKLNQNFEFKVRRERKTSEFMFEIRF